MRFFASTAPVSPSFPRKRESSKPLSPQWIPAFAGMTGKRTGMTWGARATRVAWALWIGLVAALLFALFSTAPAQAKERVPHSMAELKLTFAPVVKKVKPAVVNVYARQVVRTRRLPLLFDDPFFREFFGGGLPGIPEERVRNSLGSGVIVAPDGRIITNSHVIENATDIRVVLSDGREYEAKVLLVDPEIDLALLKVNPEEPLPTVPIGDPDALEVGDVVLAIGNPFGVGQTVTMGIVSAVGRTAVGRSPYQSFIQTDAAINPGNSGGALVNLKGELVGINTMIVSRSGGSIGIGFAVPANLVRTMLVNAKLGRVVRPWAGVKLRTITPEFAEALGLRRPHGALVEQLLPNSPLKQAGIRVGDVIVAIDGRPLPKAADFGYRWASKPVGTDATVEVLRDGRRLNFRVKRIAPPEEALPHPTVIRGRTFLSGVKVVDLTPEIARRLRARLKGGVLVVSVARGSAAERTGIERGDIILAVNRRTVRSVKELLAVLRKSRRVYDIVLWRRGGILRMRFGG